MRDRKLLVLLLGCCGSDRSIGVFSMLTVDKAFDQDSALPGFDLEFSNAGR